MNPVVRSRLREVIGMARGTETRERFTEVRRSTIRSTAGVVSRVRCRRLIPLRCFLDEPCSGLVELVARVSLCGRGVMRSQMGVEFFCHCGWIARIGVKYSFAIGALELAREFPVGTTLRSEMRKHLIGHAPILVWCRGNSWHDQRRATADSSLTTPERKNVRGPVRSE